MALQVSGKFKNKGNEVSFNLPVITFVEDGIYFFYTPALDLTGYGKTQKKAKASFGETLDQFLGYGIYKNTLLKELKKLGWKVSKKSSKPPSLVDMINDNQYLAQIFEEEKQYKKFHQTISLPALA